MKGMKIAWTISWIRKIEIEKRWFERDSECKMEKSNMVNYKRLITHFQKTHTHYTSFLIFKRRLLKKSYDFLFLTVSRTFYVYVLHTFVFFSSFISFFIVVVVWNARRIFIFNVNKWILFRNRINLAFKWF